MNEEFTKELLELLTKHKILPSGVLVEMRNQEIRARYVVLKTELGSSKQAREKLSEEFFTSEKNIDKILYGKKR